MSLKDHYKTLGLPANADLQTIKKAYRKLAFQYHPDTNKENDFTEAYFKEINEAYNILSNSSKRKQYDQERWLSGMGKRMQDEQHISPEWLLLECAKLSNHMHTVDTYRMSHSSLRDYIMLILSDAHMAVLQQHKDTETNKRIVLEILKSSKRLELRYMQEVVKPLVVLVANNSDLLAQIQKELSTRYADEKRDKYMPLFIIIVTLILCVLMYLYGSRK